MLKSGHRIVPVVGKEQDRQVKDFKPHSVGTIRLQPDGWFFKLPFIEFADEAFEYKFRPSDIIIMTFPKCGTTWTQEIVWTMQHNGDLDHPLADAPVNVRAPFIDADCCIVHEADLPKAPGDELFDMFNELCPGKNIEDGLFQQLVDNVPDPRVIKTHLPFSLLRPDLLETCKVVYVARDPRDVAVSYHHHLRVLKTHGFVGSMDDLVHHFVNDSLLWSPFWKHIKEAWNRRNHPNLHFIYYEDMKEDPRAEVVRLQKFVGTDLTDKQIDDIVKYTSFTEMKKRDNALGKIASEKHHDNPFVDMEIVKEAGGAFFRKGNAGDWKNKLTAEQVEKIEEWTRKNTKSFGPDFKYGRTTEKQMHTSQMNGRISECDTNGTVAECDMNGVVAEGHIMNGKNAEYNHMNGAVAEGNIMNGTNAEYNHMNGAVAECNHMNGAVAEGNIMNGTNAECNHMNGTVADCNYINGTGNERNYVNGTANEYNHMNGVAAKYINGSVSHCAKMNGTVVECNGRNGFANDLNKMNDTFAECNMNGSTECSNLNVSISECTKQKNRVVGDCNLTNGTVKQCTNGSVEQCNMNGTVA